MEQILDDYNCSTNSEQLMYNAK